MGGRTGESPGRHSTLDQGKELGADDGRMFEHDEMPGISNHDVLAVRQGGDQHRAVLGRREPIRLAVEHEDVRAVKRCQRRDPAVRVQRLHEGTDDGQVGARQHVGGEPHRLLAHLGVK